MIFVQAQITIAPQHRQPFLDHLRALVETSRAEPGCLSFACFEALDAPKAFTVLQEWSDSAAFDLHEASSHVAQFKANVGAMIVSRQPTRVYTVSHVGGLE